MAGLALAVLYESKVLAGPVAEIARRVSPREGKHSKAGCSSNTNNTKIGHSPHRAAAGHMLLLLLL